MKKHAPAKAMAARMMAIQPGLTRKASRCGRGASATGPGCSRVLLTGDPLGVGVQPAADLLDQAGCGRDRHRQHVVEAGVRSVIRIGYLVVVGIVIEGPQQHHLVRVVRHPPQVPQVPPVGGDGEVDLRHLSGGDLPGQVIGRIAGPLQHPDSAFVRALSDMPVADPRAAHPDPVGQPSLGQRNPQDLLTDRRAADVAGTHDADMEPGVVRPVAGGLRSGPHRVIVHRVGAIGRRRAPTAVDDDGRIVEGRAMVRVREVVEVVLSAYPQSLAEDWDTGIGLTCGDPDDVVTRVLLAVDADAVTIDEAIGSGAEMLLTHHPLLFRPIQTVAAGTAKGSLVHRMIRSGVAHFAAHTNADTAVGGVNDALASALGLTGIRPLVPHPGGDTGSGRVGTLPSPMTLRAFAAHAASRLPATVTGVRAAGDPDRPISTVAICGGAGDSYLPAAAAAGADVYLTSDLRHHVVGEFVADPANPAVVDVAHWAGEWPWLAQAAAVITAALPELTVEVSNTRTDPWTVCAASPS